MFLVRSYEFQRSERHDPPPSNLFGVLWISRQVRGVSLSLTGQNQLWWSCPWKRKQCTWIDLPFLLLFLDSRPRLWILSNLSSRWLTQHSPRHQSELIVATGLIWQCLSLNLTWSIAKSVEDMECGVGCNKYFWDLLRRHQQFQCDYQFGKSHRSL